MIIVRSPLRISIGGGGTDLPSYYRDHSGFLVSAAITKYVYITVHDTFVEEFILKYSKMERVLTTDEVQHPIVREALKMTGVNPRSLEITSMADIPAGTGLGSSGSFTVALLRALYTHQRELISPYDLAQRACEIEIDRLGEPIGKQDQFISAFGGLTSFRFMPNGEVEAERLNLPAETLYNLEENLVLFFTGYTRSASEILKDQKTKSETKDREMIQNLHNVKEMGLQIRDMLLNGDLRGFAEMMNTHWENKKKRSGGMSNPKIDEWYTLAMNNGALGGKLIGAGGGGFLMFYTEDKVRLRHAMIQAGMTEVRFRFDFEGTKVIVS
ncbi:MAG: galactokinase [Phototrophicaceae bacterium]|jgi:D-glycero-alpha-D-manno-heptose-7-phosphate kinase